MLLSKRELPLENVKAEQIQLVKDYLDSIQLNCDKVSYYDVKRMLDLVYKVPELLASSKKLRRTWLEKVDDAKRIHPSLRKQIKYVYTYFDELKSRSDYRA